MADTSTEVEAHYENRDINENQQLRSSESTASKRKLSDEEAPNTDVSEYKPNKSEVHEATTSSNAALLDEAAPNTNASKRSKRSGSESNEATTSNGARVKTEKMDEVASGTVAIKTEPVNENGDSPIIANSSSNYTSAQVSIKSEPTEEADSSDARSAQIPIKTEARGSSAAVVKTEPTRTTSPVTVSAADCSVSSSILRQSCRFGIRCYRRNPAHRSSEAHPGDADYRRPCYTTPPLGTPSCPFGNICYRRNPIHFQQYSHPPDFNSSQNIRSRLRQRRNQQQNTSVTTADATDSESDEDPFHDQGDSDLDYKPGANVDDSDGDEDEELEFNSERQNCDDFD